MLLVSPKYVHDDKLSKTYIAVPVKHSPIFDLRFFAVIRARHHLKAQPFFEFFNADISRQTATGEVKRGRI